VVEIVTRRRLSGTMGQNDENHDCHTKNQCSCQVWASHTCKYIMYHTLNLTFT